MDGIEEKLGAILNDPKMMQQILSLANSLGNGGSEKPPTPRTASADSLPDLAILQKLSGLAGQGTIDSDQKQLLQALSPYLPSDRVGKLENAMRAAKLAKFASAFLGSGSLRIPNGR